MYYSFVGNEEHTDKILIYPAIGCFYVVEKVVCAFWLSSLRIKNGHKKTKTYKQRQSGGQNLTNFISCCFYFSQL